MQHLHNIHKSRKKFLSAVSAFVMSLCLIVPTSSVFDNISLLQAEADEGVSIYDEYLSWNQLDERWGSTPMGEQTIRRVGCLITSLSVVAVDSDSIDDTAKANLGITDIEQFNPSVLANAYTNVDGFTSGGAIRSWLTIEEVIPQMRWGEAAVFEDTEKIAVAEKITDLMNNGWYVIARVENGGFHWVYVRDVAEDGSLIMSDPASPESNLYTVYPEGLQGDYWIIRGKNMPCDALSKTKKADIPEIDNVVQAPATEIPSVSDEYFVRSGNTVHVYSGIGESGIITTLSSGNVIRISQYDGNYGLIESDAFTGWVDMGCLIRTEIAEQKTGDINNDGFVDKYDLALLNMYLKQKDELPDGVSVLSSSELGAADINGDGSVNLYDISAFLNLLNN